MGTGGLHPHFNGVVAVNGADDPNDELDDILSGKGLSYGADLLVRKETGTLTGWATLSFLKADRTFPDTYSPFIPQTGRHLPTNL
ncbi:MAG: hypothetical protein Ct9H300mP15_06290 [Gemmatimonadota bacterium]|nr:MAG: hypothetical protein Ct9H300mP15_06290 [Gemmatimonadota bacterium]